MENLKSKTIESINASPVIKALLYDLDLVPEQVKEGSLDFAKMCLVVAYMEKAEALGGIKALKEFFGERK